MEPGSKHKQVHVSKNDSDGKPAVPTNEYNVELEKAAADTVTWLQVNPHTPIFDIRFNYPEGSPFTSDKFNAGQSNDEIVVPPDPNKVYRYTIYFPNGRSLDPGIIIR